LSLGAVTTFVGTTNLGFKDGYGTNVQFNYMWDVTIDTSAGLLYIADGGNYVIRKITISTGDTL
jgi:hypothetical protein